MSGADGVAAPSLGSSVSETYITFLHTLTEPLPVFIPTKATRKERRSHVAHK